MVQEPRKLSKHNGIADEQSSRVTPPISGHPETFYPINKGIRCSWLILSCVFLFPAFFLSRSICSYETEKNTPHLPHNGSERAHSFQSSESCQGKPSWSEYSVPAARCSQRFRIAFWSYFIHIRYLSRRSTSWEGRFADVDSQLQYSSAAMPHPPNPT